MCGRLGLLALFSEKGGVRIENKSRRQVFSMAQTACTTFNQAILLHEWSYINILISPAQ